jgi:hypothetical protein
MTDEGCPPAFRISNFSMSTTATATESDAYRVGIDPDDAFDDLAFTDPTVCSRCFVLIRRHDTFRPDATQGVSKYAPEERCVRAHDGDKGYRLSQTNGYGYRPIYEPRTFCGQCGSQSGRADDDPLSQRQAVSFADNLYDRLRDADVHVDKRALKYLVGQLKEDQRVADYDTEIFRRATKVAIKRARY